MSEQVRKPGYRDTLNLPATEFPMKADLARREPERLAAWRASDRYAELRRRRAGRPLWVLHDGPPYSNNHIHMGTAANKIWKDAAVRQASMAGFDSPYVPGWDNHGMPIETQVSRDFAERKEKPERLELRRACRAYATRWIDIQREEFERLGNWGDWNHPYLTMAPEFEAEILETFAALATRGFVQRGKRSIHWCPTDRTALAMAEIEYQDTPSPSILVRFPLRRDATGALAAWPAANAVAWTTTPWTLPANVGLMVDPQAEYAVVLLDGETLVLAAARLAAFAERLGRTPERLGSVRGRELVGSIFEAPFGNDSRAVDGTPYVSMEDGTGIVHTAPGHGAEDFTVGQREGLPLVCPVDEAGRFTAEVGRFAGRSVLEVDDDVIAWLRERGRLLHATRFTHAYPHCWRCRRPVIFRATDQWFLMVDHDGHRERCLELIDRAVAWDPPSSQNRIREAVRTRPDWCLSRQRSWGVGIPAVYCEGCGQPALDVRVMKRAAELTRTHGSDVWYERPVEEFLPAGYACPGCGATGPFRRETDVLDVWFDSGSTHRAVQVSHAGIAPAWAALRNAGGAGPAGAPGAGRPEILYFEGPDQHRGWFNSSLMVGVGLEKSAPFTRVCTHGWVLDAEGRAMHKSLGNVVPPLTLVEKHGADVVRWWALATDWRGDVRVGDEILQRVADAYRKVRNTFRFLLGNLADFRPEMALPEARLTRVDAAFAAHLDVRLARLQGDWTALRFHRALERLLDVCTVDLSAVFLDVSKDRLYTLAPGDPARRSAQTVLWRALRGLTLAAAPALVFTAEEIWQHHPGLLAECESVHFGRWDAREASAAETHPEWAFLLEVRDAVNAAIEPLRAARTLATTAEAEVRVTAPPEWARRLAPYGDELASLLIVARAEVVPGAPGAAVHVEVSRTGSPKCERCWTYRPDVAVDGERRGLCARCVAALEARGGITPPAAARPGAGSGA
ncbi:MAG TPA: isoleucine--tRNA ligase [Candidatus Acidoferrales bacterium]|nr:isoleucine--tRNA ligase [Candidatus Acidoferrales bacterium]